VAGDGGWRPRPIQPPRCADNDFIAIGERSKSFSWHFGGARPIIEAP
jgi:hypothetical protein